jgi:hypothetical protein
LEQRTEISRRSIFFQAIFFQAIFFQAIFFQAIFFQAILFQAQWSARIAVGKIGRSSSHAVPAEPIELFQGAS